VSRCNDFGSFCGNKKVVNEAEGRASAPSPFCLCLRQAAGAHADFLKPKSFHRGSQGSLNKLVIKRHFSVGECYVDAPQKINKI